MPIYIPKQIVPLQPTTDSPLFFLAGPIRGGGDWQSQMADQILNQEPSAHIACPSRWDSTHRLARHFHQPFSQANNRQLMWERHYLKQAGLEPNVPGCVIFWLGRESVTNPHPGPEPYAMDTRREIGKFTAFMEIMDVRMVVGGDRGFYGLDVILFELSEVLGKPFPFYETIEDVVAQAVLTARQ
ncbi:MAG: hypothetical protein PHV43_02015 [Candidatus Colwellbacteria bacterium]|nr:hypothetical protein [Candidatus Colwellbacteria bacterium]